MPGFFPASRKASSTAIDEKKKTSGKNIQNFKIKYGKMKKVGLVLCRNDNSVCAVFEKVRCPSDEPFKRNLNSCVVVRETDLIMETRRGFSLAATVHVSNVLAEFHAFVLLVELVIRI